MPENYWQKYTHDDNFGNINEDKKTNKKTNEKTNTRDNKRHKELHTSCLKLSKTLQFEKNTFTIVKGNKQNCTPSWFNSSIT